jgi:hypothetical protein
MVIDGRTALHYAASCGQQEMGPFLLNHDALIDAADIVDSQLLNWHPFGRTKKWHHYYWSLELLLMDQTTVDVLLFIVLLYMDMKS